MGTRSSYRIMEEYTTPENVVKTNKHVNVYMQFDGYPEGHPLDVAKWLNSGSIVNGLPLNPETIMFNGAGCLAAQFIERFKSGAGGTYVYPMSHYGKCWENYLYDIIVKDKSIKIIAYENNTKFDGNRVSKHKIFEGTPAEFIAKYEKGE